MAELQQEVKQHLDKTTNTIILDYVLWLSAKTILEEASNPPRQPLALSKGRRLVGLVDGIILTFDITNRPKFAYTMLTRRLRLAGLVILFVYRNSRSRWITRRSSETNVPRRTEVDRRTTRFLARGGLTSLVPSPDVRTSFVEIRVAESITRQARHLLGMAATDDLEAGYRSTTLLDALEEFMAVSANSLHPTLAVPSQIWMEIANRFCAFAALEAYLVHGATGLDPLCKCFSFEVSKDPDTGNHELDALFAARDTGNHIQFNRIWTAQRSSILAHLIPPSSKSSDSACMAHASHESLDVSDDLPQRLLTCLRELNYPAFRTEVLDYLSAVLGAMEDPELCRYSHHPDAHQPLLDKSILCAPGMISIAHEEPSLVDPAGGGRGGRGGGGGAAAAAAAAAAGGTPRHGKKRRKVES